MLFLYINISQLMDKKINILFNLFFTFILTYTHTYTYMYQTVYLLSL